MKRTVKKITLSRETLRSLDGQELAEAAGGATYPCYPATYAPSCYRLCPVKLTDNCG